MQIIVFVLIGALFAWSVEGNDKMGPYRIIMRGVEDCSPDGDPNVLFKTYPKIKRANRTTMLIGGNAYFRAKLDDSIKLKIQVDQLSSQGWKKNYFTTDVGGKGACQIGDEYAPETSQLFYQALDGNHSCPLDPGNYTIAYIPWNVHLTGVPVFFYNKYRVNIYLFYPDFGGAQVGCVASYVDIVPDTKKG